MGSVFLRQAGVVCPARTGNGAGRYSGQDERPAGDRGQGQALAPARSARNTFPTIMTQTGSVASSSAAVAAGSHCSPTVTDKL